MILFTLRCGQLPIEMHNLQPPKYPAAGFLMHLSLCDRKRANLPGPLNVKLE